jgi:hypothetical protein
MAFENRGSIWRNEKKETDSHPDFTGTINVGGVEYWLNGWKRAPDASPKSPAMKFTVKPKEARRADPISSGRGRKDMDEDSIPF